jgi:hypothetical protein
MALSPARFLPSAWLRLLGVAVLLLACASAGKVALASGADFADQTGAPATTLAALPVPTPVGVTVAAVSPLRTVSQPRLLSGALSILLSVARCLGPRMLPGYRTDEPPRLAPGRRGRALLQAYLN